MQFMLAFRIRDRKAGIRCPKLTLTSIGHFACEGAHCRRLNPFKHRTLWIPSRSLDTEKTGDPLQGVNSHYCTPPPGLDQTSITLGSIFANNSLKRHRSPLHQPNHHNQSPSKKRRPHGRPTREARRRPRRPRS